MVARRRLDFGTPASASKRQNTTAPLILYRAPKSEIKYFNTNIPYTGLTATSACINLVDSGATITSTSGRVGNKIKIHRITGIVTETSSSATVRVMLLLPKVAATAPTVNFGQPNDPAEMTTLYDKFHNNGTNWGATGSHINVKLPLGIVAHYDGQGGTTIQRNAIYMAVATVGNENCVINARIWYTDA